MRFSTTFSPRSAQIANTVLRVMPLSAPADRSGV